MQGSRHQGLIAGMVAEAQLLNESQNDGGEGTVPPLLSEKAGVT